MYAVFSCLQPSHSCSIMPFGAFVNPRMISAKSASDWFAGTSPSVREGASIKSLKVKPRENEIVPTKNSVLVETVEFV